MEKTESIKNPYQEIGKASSGNTIIRDEAISSYKNYYL